MKYNHILFVISSVLRLVLPLFFLQSTNLAQPDISWTMICGGYTNDYLNAIVQTSDGGYAAVGWSFSYGSGNGDAWVVKIDAEGNIIWEKTYTGAGTTRGFDIQETSDGGFIVVGETLVGGPGNGYDTYLLKTNSMGETEWWRSFNNGYNDVCHAVVETNDGGFFMVGEADANGSMKDCLLIKTDNLGFPAWTATYGEPWWTEQCSDCIQSADGVLMAIASRAEWIFAPEPQYDDSEIVLLTLDSLGVISEEVCDEEENEWVCSISEISSGRFVITGRSNSFGGSNYDYFWVYYRKDWGFHNFSVFDTNTSDILHDALWLGNGFIFTGHSSASKLQRNIFTLRTGFFGEHYWDYSPENTFDEVSTGIVEGHDSGYLVCGFSDQYGSDDYDGFIIKFESDLGIETTPQSVETASVYPNPAEGEVRISYNRITSGRTQIAVYDVTGRLMTNLISRDENAGSYCVKWFPGNNAAGLYLISIDTGFTRSTSRLIICN